MRSLRRFLTRLGNLAARRRHEERFKEEIEEHLALQTAENVRAGLSPVEARRRAILKFGAVEEIKEEYRAERGMPFIETLLQDIRHASRLLRKSPGFTGFTAVALLTLAIGIGANTAIVSLVNSILLRPLAFRQPQQLYLIREIIPQLTKFYPTFPANFPNFLVWRQEAHSFDQIALAEDKSFDLSGLGPAEVIEGGQASANLFDVLGVRPALGRAFLPEEDQPGHDHVVILTDSFWRSHLHADPSIREKTITLNGVPYQIVGVLPASFHFPSGDQLGPLTGFDPHLALFKPLGLDPKDLEPLGGFDFAAIGRLKPGVTPSQALAELNVVQAQIAKEAKENVDLRAELLPLEGQVVGSARSGLILLLAAVGAVLLIVCVNLANLLLARLPGRMREAALRRALGASRARLMRQMLSESLLLGILGGALGIWLASFGVHWVVQAAPQTIPRIGEVTLDGRVLWFAAILSIMTALFFGLLPAWRAAHAEPQETLKFGATAVTENRHTRRHRQWLIGIEVGLSTLLLILAGLLTTSLVRLLRVDTGFNIEHVLAADVDLSPPNYSKWTATLSFYDKVLSGIRAVPGVISAGWVSRLPFKGQVQVSGVYLPGMKESSAPLANYRTVSPGYFATMDIPLTEGRDFSAADRGQYAVIVSHNLAARFWPGQSAVGKQMMIQWGDDHLAQVIGVVGDIRTLGLDTAPLLMVYCVPSTQEGPRINPPAAASIVLRTAISPTGAVSAVRRVIQSIDPGVPITALRPLRQIVSQSVDTQRFQLSLALLFAGSALFLASLGIFGVVAYTVEQRRQEFGIRMALGAQSSGLRGMVVRQGMTPVLAGLAAGTVVALWEGRLMKGFLFDVSAFDPLTIGCVASVIVLVALLACYIPARRAMRVDPIVALRYE
jgi:predicted permease